MFKTPNLTDLIDSLALKLVANCIFYNEHLNDISADFDGLNQQIEDMLGAGRIAAVADLQSLQDRLKAARVNYDKMFELVKRNQVLLNRLLGRIDELDSLKLRAEMEGYNKTNFLARMSHDIRTPMNAIIGMSELALRDYGKPEAVQYIRNIRQSGEGLLGLLNDILDFSKVNSGRLEIISETYQPLSVLNDLVTIVRVRLLDSPVKLEIDFSPDIPANLIGDETRLRQILLNLLSNAMKYTSAGFIKFSARAELPENNGSVGEKNARLIFTITDSGLGIQEQHLPQLFNDFARFDSVKNKNVQGTGLGLSIARSLCRALGGDISVESEYGKGSTFTAVLQQKYYDYIPMGEWRDDTCVAYEKEENICVFTAPSAQLLVVDDLNMNLQVVDGLLAPYEMQIDLCESGEEAVKMASTKKYDLVFMDHLMPEMDGIETTAVIRLLPGDYYSTVPIIALTANAIVGARDEFIANQFTDFLSKPIVMPQLIAILLKYLPAEKIIKTAN